MQTRKPNCRTIVFNCSRVDVTSTSVERHSVPFNSARSAELHFSTKPRKLRRAGLSLLEVVLALAILAVAAALLAQVTKQATDNGLMAKRLSTAQMLCESKMSEVLAGAIPLTSSSWTQITDSGRRGSWYYQIQTTTAERPNMIGVRLSVTDQPDTTNGNPELFYIVRWMIDPSLGLDTPPETTSTTDTSSGGTSSSSAGGIQ